MKTFCLSVTLLFLSSFLGAENAPQKKRPQSSDGIIYEGMPRSDLAKLGFSEDLLVTSDTEGEEEYLTFPDITTLKEGDLITFYLFREKVVDWFRGESMGTFEKGFQ